MPAVNATRFGANAGGSDDTALFLKTYMGVFTEAWRSATFLWDAPGNLIHRETVENGKSFQHLMWADLPDPENFVPGNELLGQQFEVEEGTVTVDQYLVSHNYVPRDQMKLSHFKILPRLARSQARRLGRAYDGRVMRLAALGARQTTAVTKNGLAIHSGGNRVTRAGAGAAATDPVLAYPRTATGAANLRADLRTLALREDQDNIPRGTARRGIFFTPEMNDVLTFDTTAQVFSRDYIQDQNNQQKREVNLIEGFTVMGLPNFSSNGGPMPNSNVATGLSKYQGNFTAQTSDGIPVAITIAEGEDGGAGIGVVTFETVQQEVVYYPEKMSWLVMSYLYVGCDIMNPWLLGSVEAIT